MELTIHRSGCCVVSHSLLVTPVVSHIPLSVDRSSSLRSAMKKTRILSLLILLFLPLSSALSQNSRYSGFAFFTESAVVVSGRFISTSKMTTKELNLLLYAEEHKFGNAKLLSRRLSWDDPISKRYLVSRNVYFGASVWKEYMSPNYFYFRDDSSKPMFTPLFAPK